MTSTQTYSEKSAAVKAAKKRADKGEFSLNDVEIIKVDDRWAYKVNGADDEPVRELDEDVSAPEAEAAAQHPQDEADAIVAEMMAAEATAAEPEQYDAHLAAMPEFEGDVLPPEPLVAAEDLAAQYERDTFVPAPVDDLANDPEAVASVQAVIAASDEGPDDERGDEAPAVVRTIPDEDFNVSFSLSCTPTQAREMAELLAKKLGVPVHVGFGGDWPPGYSVDPSERRQRSSSTGGGRREKAGPDDGARGLPAGKSGKLYALAQRDEGVLRTDLTERNGGRCINWKGFLEALAKRRGHVVTVTKPGDGTVVYRVRSVQHAQAAA